MNKQIKRLALQAEKYADDNFKTHSEIYSEKLAELILEDVMNICELLGDEGADGHYCFDAIAKKYKLHQWSGT
jgi:hypothetical protein